MAIGLTTENIAVRLNSVLTTVADAEARVGATDILTNQIGFNQETFGISKPDIDKWLTPGGSSVGAVVVRVPRADAVGIGTQQAQAAIENTTNELLNELRAYCPVKTGAARRSIEVTGNTRPSAYYVYPMPFAFADTNIFASMDVEYARYVVRHNPRIGPIRNNWFDELCQAWYEPVFRQVYTSYIRTVKGQLLDSIDLDMVSREIIADVIAQLRRLLRQIFGNRIRFS